MILDKIDADFEVIKILSDKLNSKILISLLGSEVKKIGIGSLSFKELLDITNEKRYDELINRIEILKKNNFIDSHIGKTDKGEEFRAFFITEKGKELLNKLGINESKINQIAN